MSIHTHTGRRKLETWQREGKGEREKLLEDTGMHTQMKCVAAALCLLSILPSCYSISSSGECYFNAKATCEHKGQMFDIGESWVNDECFQCVCFEPFGVGCCEHGKQPVDFPDWCEAVRKPGSCTVAVVMKANHKLPCLFGRKNQLRLGDGPAWKSENDPLF